MSDEFVLTEKGWKWINLSVFYEDVRSAPPDLQSRTTLAQKWADLLRAKICLIPCVPEHGSGKGLLWGYNIFVQDYPVHGGIMVTPA